MKKAGRRLQISIALLLIVSFVTITPMQIFAQTIDIEKTESVFSSGSNQPVAEGAGEEPAQEPHILTEITENRDAYTKHFLLSDGNFMAVQYEYPVHFKAEDSKSEEESNDKDNEWVEYDNRMDETTEIVTDDSETEDVSSPVEETTEEVSTSPIEIEEEIENTTENEAQNSFPQSNLESTEDYSQEYSSIEEDIEVTQENEPEKEILTEVPTEAVEEITQPVEEPTQTIEETTEEITEAVEETTEPVFENKESDFDVKLAKRAKKSNMVKIKTDNYQISWGYKNINKSKVKFIENEVELEGDEAFLTPTNVSQEAMYYNVYKDVDLQYIITPIGVKENIILKSQNAQAEFEMTYKFKGLTAVQKDEWTIELHDKKGEVVYSILAPFMTDENGEYSTKLSLSIVNQKNNKLTVKLSADEKWLQEDQRAYPVVIDPAFNTSQEWGAVQSTYINSSKPDTAYGYGSSTGYTGTVYAGTFGQGMYRSFIKLKELPTLNKGDMVVDAYLNLHLFQNGFYKDLYVGAYHVKNTLVSTGTAPSGGSWEQSKLSWNLRPNFEAEVLDYEKFVKSDPNAWHDWNVTKSVKRWYDGEANNGIMLKVLDEASADQCASFYSGSYPSSSVPRSVFTIVYRNNKGLEDYWDYTSFNVGTAGTAYINDYTGNLVFVHEDVSTAGSRMPAAITHVFNNYMANTKYTKSMPYVGYGWRTNIQQTLLPSSQFGLTGEAKTQYPYVWTDGDGTDHYFYNKIENGITKYYDEDGLKLQLTIHTSTPNAMYRIRDEKGTVIDFDKNGLMRKITDANSNRMLINFDSDEKTITSVTDGASKTLSIIKTTSGTNYTSKYTDAAGRTKTMIYTDGRLTTVKNPDGKQIYFTYDTDGSMKSIQDVDGYKVVITYTSLKSGKQVKSIQEYGTGGAAGQKMTFDRSKYNSTEIHSAGVDGIYSSTVSGTDDLINTMQFDNYGRTTSIKANTGNKDMGAAGCQYTSGAPNSSGSNLNTINRVTTQYSLGSNAVNLLVNHNMEASGSWATAQWMGNNTFTGAFTTAQKYIGKQSYKLTSTAYTGTSAARAYQNVATALTPGTTYALSGYVKTTGITANTANSGALLCATSFNADGTTTDFHSDYVTGSTDTAIDSGWRRVSVTFTVPSNSSSMRVNMALRGTVGTAYFDAIQLEQYNQPNAYNILENPSLENGTTGWTFANIVGSDGRTTEHKKHGSYGVRMVGDPTRNKEMVQQVPISGNAKDTYIISGWAKANAVRETSDRPSKFKISIKINYTSGDPVWKHAAEFNESISAWQFASSAFTLEDPDNKSRVPTSIAVHVRYFQQANIAFFDNIQLIKDVAQSYTYDDDGNVISVAKDAEQKSTMEYSNSDLTKSVDGKGYAYTYNYDSKHNMTKATSQNGITSNYTYDSTGAPTRLEVKNKAATTSYLTTATYTASKAFVKTTTDVDGKATTYNYNENTGTLTNVTDTSGTTKYTYDANTNQLKTVSKYLEKEERTISNTYGYSASKKNLTSIGHNGMTYSMAYDTFGNMTQTKVGSQTLASYSYGSNNNSLLQRLTYGTGAYIDYTYDEFGNLTLQKNSGTNAYRWYTNRAGFSSRHQDLLNKVQYDYSYDTTGRLVQKAATDTTKAAGSNKNISVLEYGYDANNNVTKLNNITACKTARNTYTYGKDNLPTQYKIDNARNIDYTYDDLNRLSKVTLGTDTPLYMHYYYYKSARGGTYATSKLSEEGIVGKYYYYTYDDKGNITEIKQRVNGVLSLGSKYNYDELNQLVYDMDYTTNKLNQYIYDDAGNLITVYKSKLGSNGAPISSSTIRYTYGDSNWKDKLTNYNGTAITYDAIGNPLSYRNGIKFTWQNGRQLKSSTSAGGNVTYTYDSDGYRKTKTVNGVKYTYQYENGKLIHETRGEKSFNYYYDAYGYLSAIKYRLTPTGTEIAVYATHNSRGDVLGLYTGSGALAAQYTYDTWGNVTSVKNASGAAITDPNHAGNLNPFRYRGYYMDTEIGLYYLVTRYYDPVTYRFINADGYFQTGQGFLDKNMGAYCLNNPVMRVDPTGNTSSIGMQESLVNREGKYTLEDILIKMKAELAVVCAGTAWKTGKTKSGWSYQIHKGNTNTNTKTHIHIQKNNKSYSQNLDGSKHDKNSNSKGDPPNKVIKELKEKKIWDWENSPMNYKDPPPYITPNFDMYEWYYGSKYEWEKRALYGCGSGYVLPHGISAPSPSIGISPSPSWGFGFAF